MKLSIKKSAPAIAIALGFAITTAAQDITPVEKNEAVRYLEETRNALVAAVSGLSDAQWKFKSAPDRWSIAEVLEHLAVLEDMFANNISAQLAQAPPGKPDTDFKKVDGIILAKVPDRSTKAQAPEVLVPTGRWTPQASLERFIACRRDTTTFLTSASNLRAHVLAHPALGPLDAYEWILAVAAHTKRHTKQILEVKADAGFPTN